MEFSLPPNKDGQTEVVDSAGHPLVIVGANGAGKSRFTSKMISSLGNRAYSLSALHGLYVTDADAVSKSSVGRICGDSAGDKVAIGKSNELDLLLSQLMHDEMLNLLNYKLAKADGKNAELRLTKLDRVVGLWQEIFPENKILVESGSVLFSRSNGDDRYSALRLSDGERAVIYYIAGVLYAPKGSAIFINSPEIFLHPTIMQSLWSRIELLRPDCTFIYTTHDLEFTSSRSNATVVWVRDYDPAAVSWDYA
ncbi:MAG: AAA family ATPase, partial [Muribaculaceae bacterium]|nr:AAA family ATPase [Muribaculaceae bacterium]